VLRSGNVDLLDGKGLWSSSGRRFFNVRNLRVGQIPEGISIYEFDDRGNLLRAIDADRAQPMRDRNWKLIGVRYKNWTDGRVATTTLPELELGPFWSAEELPAIGHSLDSMSPGALYQYAAYLQATGQPYAEVRMAFWQKLALPFSAFSMVLLAAVIGTTFGSTRSARFGAQVLIGAIVGVGFYLLTQIINTGGQLLGLDAGVIAISPIALALLLSAALAFVARRPR
jgi:lipopolysaccharide export system permease protein